MFAGILINDSGFVLYTAIWVRMICCARPPYPRTNRNVLVNRITTSAREENETVRARAHSRNRRRRRPSAIQQIDRTDCSDTRCRYTANIGIINVFIFYFFFFLKDTKTGKKFVNAGRFNENAPRVYVVHSVYGMIIL